MISLTGYSQTAVVPVGSGSSSDPYLISTLGHLYWVSTSLINSSTFSASKFFLQTNDIDASATSSWTNKWIPIGGRTSIIPSSTSDDENRVFQGTYNGAGFTISGITYSNNQSLNNLNGFFGSVSGAILNLKLSNLSITTNSQKTGGLAAMLKVGGKIYNCSTSGNILSTNVSAGGLVGQNQGTIFNSYSNCNVTATSVAGGLLGLNQRSVYDCYSNGSVTTTANGAHIGGLIAEFSVTPLFRSYANTSVTIASGTTTTYDGGLIGRLRTNMSNISGSNNYWNTDLYAIGKGTANTNSFFGTGLTSAQLKVQSNFGSNWDFVNTWGFGSDGYPTLVNKPNTWLGVNTNWSNTANWSLGIVPSSNTLSLPTSTTAFSAKDLVHIPSGLANYPVLTANITAYSITLEDGATIDLNGFSITKSFFFEQTGSTTSTWTGATNTLWNEPTNWNPQLTPPSTNDIVIPNIVNLPTIDNSIETGNLTIQTGASLTLQPISRLKVNGNITNNGQIIFKSDATGSGMFDQFTGTITGSGTVQIERYIPAKRAYRFLSPSVSTTTSINANWQEGATSSTDNPNPGYGTHITGTGGATSGFDSTATNNASMYTFNNISGAWEPVTNTNTNVFTAGTPYRLMVRGDRLTDLTTNTPTATVTTLRATGTLKTGNFVPTINQTADGYSLVGNPYQAPIDIKAILTASSNMSSGVVYYWDPTLNARGGYVTRNLTTDVNDVTSSFNQYVQPGQAVFVKRDNTANAASVTITESHKSVANGAAGVFRTTSPNDYGLLRVNLQANTNNQWQTIEGSLALFNDNFSWNVTSEDATKMSNLDEEVSFVQNNTSLAIACVSAPSVTSELPIQLNNLRHSNYQWQFELSNYQGERPYLYDTQNNTYTEITNGATVPFTATTPAANRFKIVFQPSALNADDFTHGLVLYPNPAKAGDSFYVQGSTAAEVTVYNVLGQHIPVQVKSQGNALQVTPMQTLSQGIYLVTVTTEGKTQHVKWIVE